MCVREMTIVVVLIAAVGCGGPQETTVTPTRQVVRTRDPAPAGDTSPSPDRVVRYLDTDEPIPEMPDVDLRFVFPVEEPDVTSPFGMRRDPLDRSRHRMHRGTDFRGPTGTPVYATEGGRALMAGYCDRGTGNCVVLEHPSGWRSQYFHLSAVHIRVGTWVERGVHIGDIGSTGRSTGPHLHFQLSHLGVDVDPMEHLEPQTEQASTSIQE